MSVVSVDINYCRVFNIDINLPTQTVIVTYVLGNLTGNVHTDHRALTNVGVVTYPASNGINKAAVQAAIQAIEPYINFAGGDALI